MAGVCEPTGVAGKICAVLALLRPVRRRHADLAVAADVVDWQYSVFK